MARCSPINARTKGVRAMTDSKITFQGDGPFPMLLAQQAAAIGYSGNGVTVLLKVLDPESGEKRDIQFQLVQKEAEKLARSLMREVANAAE